MDRIGNGKSDIRTWTFFDSLSVFASGFLWVSVFFAGFFGFGFFWVHLLALALGSWLWTWTLDGHGHWTRTWDSDRILDLTVLVVC